MLLYIGSSSGFGIIKCFISIVPFTLRGSIEFLIVLMEELMGIFISVWIIKLHIEAIIYNEWNIITFVVLLIRFIVFLHSIGILVFICHKFCNGGLHLNPNDKNLKVIKDIYSSQNKDDDKDHEICAICHEPFSVERLHEVARTHCPHGHYFHQSCISAWVWEMPFRMPTCPLCVQPLDLLDPIERVQHIDIRNHLQDEFIEAISKYVKYYKIILRVMNHW